MRTPRTAGLVVGLAAAMTLVACSTGGGASQDPTSDSGEQQGTQDVTITVAHEQEFNAYNNGTSADNATKNAVVLNQVLTTFWEFGPDGTVVPNEEFGTYEKTSDSPLTVEYSINPDAVWSDGEPIDCDDVVVDWAANSGTYEGFDPASTTGYDLMEKPTCADGDKDFTVVYTDTFSDWVAGVGTFLPAHVVEERSGVEDVVAAVQADDAAAMATVAQFWNTGWHFNPGEYDAATTPSSGPYTLSTWEPGQSIALEANEEYWGTPASSQTIVVRFIEQESQAQALQNGDIMIAEPQANPDVLGQLEAIGDTVTVAQGDEFTYEHLDFNFDTVFADANLRKAFALCVPRDQIVENLIVPVNPEAEVLQSRFFLPFQPAYQEVSQAIQDGTYDTADVAASKALVDEAGAAGTVVRIGYQTPNQRRTNTVDLIRASCNQAGFDVQDAGQADFFGNGLDNGNFDVALFAWAGSPLVSGSGSTYSTDGGNNNGNYANPAVDGLMASLDTTPDADEQQRIITDVETILWDDLATIPIFAHPGLVAYDSTVENVTFQPSQSQVTWNMQRWSMAS
ncbi:ABC transporter substrate-binding protein [Angustibacter speluncae]